MFTKRFRLGSLIVGSLASFGQNVSPWKAVSKENPGIEFQWARPANNSCEVSFRDLKLKTKTSMMVSIHYLPHKAAKQSVESDGAQIVISSSGMGTRHVAECEAIVSASISHVNRR